MPTRNLNILPILIGLCVVLAACGQSGELYLPPPPQPDPPEQQDR
jgi:predicted small lipoprotein YifL